MEDAFNLQEGLPLFSEPISAVDYNFGSDGDSEHQMRLSAYIGRRFRDPSPSHHSHEQAIPLDSRAFRRTVPYRYELNIHPGRHTYPTRPVKPSRGRKTRKPKNKDTIGYMVWQIIGGENAEMPKAALRLEMSVRQLDAIIQGKIITQQLLETKKWRQAFALYYLKTWQELEAVFEEYAARQPLKNGRKADRPENPDSLEHILWKIIGGEKADMALAARRLGLSPGALSFVMHGNRRVSQTEIVRKNWRGIFESYYSDAWTIYQADFDKCANTLFVRDMHRAVREPKNQQSLGHVLWMILGGAAADLDTASQNLGISRPDINAYLRGSKIITRSQIRKKNWRRVLADAYADNWSIHKNNFEKYAATLPSRRLKNSEIRFGAVLRQILQDEDFVLATAANRLEINHNYLLQLIAGKQTITAQSIANKCWRDVFAQYYSRSWLKHQAEFERYAAALPARNLRNSRVPKNKESLGYVVWNILGGHNINPREAAKQLRIRPAELSSIIHGKLIVTQDFLVTKGWREAFTGHYNKTWTENRDAFERRAIALSRKYGHNVNISEPTDKENFGHTVWEIIGGEKSRGRHAASVLGIDAASLRAIIHGNKEISQTFLLVEQWAERLAASYPLEWSRHHARYAEYVHKMPKGTAFQKPQLGEPPIKLLKEASFHESRLDESSTLGEWRQAIGVFITRTLAERGDMPEDILADVQVTALKKPNTWLRIGRGDVSLTTSLFKDAVKEICRLYEPEIPGQRPGPLRMQAERLLALG